MKNKQNRKAKKASLRALRQPPVCPVNFKTYWGSYDYKAYPRAWGATLTCKVRLGVFSTPHKAALYAAKFGYDFDPKDQAGFIAARF